MRIGAALFGIAFVLGGCVTEETDAGGGDWDGDGKADGASSSVPLIQTNSPFYWGDSDYAAFTATYASIYQQVLQAPLADADMLTARLQAWVDRIDDVVRREVERNIGEPLVAPKPIVKVLPSGRTLNAWVSPVVACTGSLVPGATAGTTDTTYLGRDVSYHGSGYSCVRPGYPAADEFKTFWERAKPTCKLTADLQITGCEVQSYGSPGELAFLSTSPYIHVSTDLIAESSEAVMVVVLAHELGHYYRSHVSDAKIQRYNFWYETQVAPKKVPVPSPTATQPWPASW